MLRIVADLGNTRLKWGRLDASGRLDDVVASVEIGSQRREGLTLAAVLSAPEGVMMQLAGVAPSIDTLPPVSASITIQL